MKLLAQQLNLLPLNDNRIHRKIYFEVGDAENGTTAVQRKFRISHKYNIMIKDARKREGTAQNVIKREKRQLNLKELEVLDLDGPWEDPKLVLSHGFRKVSCNNIQG